MSSLILWLRSGTADASKQTSSTFNNEQEQKREELLKEVMAMLLLKACPKCGGDMQLSGDIYGSYASCLNCGFLLDVPDDQKVEVALRQRAQKKAA